MSRFSEPRNEICDMAELSIAELGAKIKEILVSVLDLELRPEQLADDTSLYSSVLQMDSLSLLHLLVALEDDLGIEIDDEDVMNANLETVGNLVDMVRQAGGAVTDE